MKNILTPLVALLGMTLSLFSADATPKSFQIRNCKFDLLLRPENASNADGTRIVLYPAAPWKCMTWKMSPVGDSTFQLQNHFTDKTFHGITNQAAVGVVQIPFAHDATKRPAWRFTKLPNGFYRIADVVTGEVLTGRGREQVVLAPWENKQQQEWELIDIDPTTLTM